MRERFNIGAMAKDFRAQGAPDDGTPTGDFSYRSPEAIKAWHDMKPELFALTAVLTDRIINRAISHKSERPPFGLLKKKQKSQQRSHRTNPHIPILPVTSIDEILDTSDLAFAMDDTLDNAVDEELYILDTTKNPDTDTVHAQSTYKRFQTLFDFRRKYIFGDSFISEDQIFYGGLGTAAMDMVGTIDVIPKVLKRYNKPLSPEDLTTTATNSFPLIAELAMKHMYDFADTEERINRSSNKEELEFVPDFDPEAFVLVEARNGNRLDIPSSTYGKQSSGIFVKKVQDLQQTSPVAVGCPAMVNFDGQSAVRKLWDWHVEIAEAIYTRKFGK